MKRRHIQLILWFVVAVSLIPALILVAQRISIEGQSRTITLVMDEVALTLQANLLGLDSFELAQRYKEQGLNGIALYENGLNDLAAQGKILMKNSMELYSETIPEASDTIPWGHTFIRELVPGSLDMMLAKNTPAPSTLELDGDTWLTYLGNASQRPAGPDLEAIARWAQDGWDIAYRPRNFYNLSQVGLDFPPEASYLIHSGTSMAGHPNQLDDLIATSQDYITGIVEGAVLDGKEKVAGKIPVVRVFSISQQWLNTLAPTVAVDKFMLAANERGARILYIRPYTAERMGDMYDNTELLLSQLITRLTQDGYRITTVEPFHYDTVASLRWLSALGVIAGLGLLILMYPGIWGWLVALAVLGLGIVAGNGFNWDALALAAALSFPVLGFGLLPLKAWNLALATLISLAGAVLLAAVGTDQNAILAIEPFAGVAATLLIPPLLFLFHFALKYRRPAAYINDFWHYPIRLGDAALVLIALLALALVFLRRGNLPIIGVSGIEIALRDFLSDYFARPRFKEIVGHPLAVLALLQQHWPDWMRGLLLTGGVVAQATILNSFSHYHTPLLISLERSLVALVIGVIIGLLLIPVTMLGVRLTQNWLQSTHG